MRIGFPRTGTPGRDLRPEVAGPEHEVPPEPDMMDKDTASGASFELPVAADEALTAFHHPYAYAAVKGVPY